MPEAAYVTIQVPVSGDREVDMLMGCVIVLQQGDAEIRRRVARYLAERYDSENRP